MQQIVILERVSPGPLTLRYVLRATVPAARRMFFAAKTGDDSAKTSTYVDTPAEDLADIQTGAVVERVEVAEFDGMSFEQIQAALIARQQAYQAEVDADNPWKYYGTSYDGRSWTMVGVD